MEPGHLELNVVTKTTFIIIYFSVLNFNKAHFNYLPF